MFEISLTTAINEWDFIGQDTLVGLGLSATINKFKNGVALRKMVRLGFLIPTHHS